MARMIHNLRVAPIAAAGVTVAALLSAPAASFAAGPQPASPGPRPATPSAPAASAVHARGSILYIKNHDVYLTDSTGRHTKRITRTGWRRTADHTGGIGFLAPSQSADGKIVVAVRNQSIAGQDGAEQGWIWVMRRNGALIRKFKPYQVALIGGLKGCVGGKYRQFPLGILNAKVSPNGKHVAFDEKFDVVGSGSCQAAQSYATFVVNINGRHGRQVKRANHDGSYLELGQWLSNTRLLLDDLEFGSVADFYADLPRTIARRWFGAPDNIDNAYGQPVQHAHKLATTGYSEYTKNNVGASLGVVRFWNSNGPTGKPAPICEYRATAGGSTRGKFGNALPRAEDASLAPDGTAAVWDEVVGDNLNTPSEGIYIVQLRPGRLPRSAPCPYSKTELVSKGSYPSWSPAPVAIRR